MLEPDFDRAPTARKSVQRESERRGRNHVTTLEAITLAPPLRDAKPDWLAATQAASIEADGPRRRAEEIIAILKNSDPLTGVTDPAVRAALTRELNGNLARYNAPLYQPNGRVR